MAAAKQDISKHFKALRVDPGRSKRRPDPWATGFEDESDDDRRSRAKTKAPPVSSPVVAPTRSSIDSASRPTGRSSFDAFGDNDDNFLNSSPARKGRFDSPGPGSLPSRVSDRAGLRSDSKTASRNSRSRASAALAVGNAAYLDDSSDEDDDRNRASNLRFLNAGNRADRRPSPAPRHSSDHSNKSENSRERSPAPQEGAGYGRKTSVVPRHTVASAFAGTKYLQDSDSENEATAAARRDGTDVAAEDESDDDEDLSGLGLTTSAQPKKKTHLEVKRVDKPRAQSGGGVSWRAFSAGRFEQRSAELEALQTSLRQRGKSISFGAHAVTDEGKKVPLAESREQLFGGRGPNASSSKPKRGRSPPRRAEDVKPPAEEEVDDPEEERGGSVGSASGVGIYDPTEYKTNPFTGTFATLTESQSDGPAPTAPAHSPVLDRPLEDQTVKTAAEGAPVRVGQGGQAPPYQTAQVVQAQEAPFPTSAYTQPLPTDNNGSAVQTPPLSPKTMSDSNGITSYIGSVNEKLAVTPTIPESRELSHVSSPVQSPIDGSTEAPTRNSSMRSMRTRAQRIPGMNPGSRRNSRRSTSANGTSASPAQAFLASWGKGGSAEPAPEPLPDDEGQKIGLKDDREYIIGRTVGRGGFGVVKELHAIDEATGRRITRAVKIVRKIVPEKDEGENEKAQQELEHEVSVWRYLKHKHILDLHAVYDTDFATFCVMDLNVGGTLFDLVRTARACASDNDGRKGLDPALAKRYAYQLACGLRYLHEDIRVCHRDVKLENCLIDMSAPDAEAEGGVLRLCDFGLADFLRDESIDDALQRFDTLSPPKDPPPRPTSSSIIGTLEYASPKGLSVSRKLFETAGDVWAFGVIVYAVCTGDLPFRHPMPAKTVQLILHADWDLAALQHAAAGASDVIELVGGCLEPDIDRRLTIGDALATGWFDGCRHESDEDEGSGNLWRA